MKQPQTKIQQQAKPHLYTIVYDRYVCQEAPLGTNFQFLLAVN